MQRGGLRAVRFDAERIETRGEPASLVQRIWYPLNASPQATVSDAGTLAYVAGVFSTTLSNNVEPTRTLAWVDRSGVEQPIPGAPPRGYVLPRISPDGQRVALDVRDRENDIWVFDFVRSTLQQVTFDPAGQQSTADARVTRILFSSIAGETPTCS